MIGLATGATPVAVYAELVRLHKEENLSFSNVITFNLDEYYPMQPNSAQSYVTFMKEHLFDHIDIPKENINIPDGTLSLEAIPAFCLEYERKIGELGGLDIRFSELDVQDTLVLTSRVLRQIQEPVCYTR